MWFDERRLDDEAVLTTGDLRLRGLAESGARVRRESVATADALAEAVARQSGTGRPRAVIAAGPDSRLLRAVLEPVCPVPFVAWPHHNLPGWAGSLDLVVVLAPDGSDAGAASAVAEASRRGCRVVVATSSSSLVAGHAAGGDTTVLPAVTADPLALAVVVLDYLGRISLGPTCEADGVADALDEMATACSPYRDLATNPAKTLAIALADGIPVLWGGSVLAARAARRVAESLRRASGRAAVAGGADQLLPLLEATRQRDVFDDPFAEGGGEARPILVVFDDGADDPFVVDQRRQLVGAADARGVRVELLAAEAPTEMARYASLLLLGTYTAEYLGLGLTDD